jgi:rhodanese-related sulfurtransferase
MKGFQMLLPEACTYYRDKLAFETDAWDLNEMLQSGENVVVIDARSEAAYNQEHIPQALSFPHRLMNAQSTNQLDRQALFVTYCDGIGCNASTKGALKLAELGFNVKELLGGLDWWKRDGYPTISGLVQIK